MKFDFGVVSYITDKCRPALKSRMSKCSCESVQCILDTVSTLRDKDFIQYIEQCKTISLRSVFTAFICSATDFERLANRCASLASSGALGLLIPVDKIEGGGCELFRNCIELARNRRSFLSIWNLALRDSRVCVDFASEKAAGKAFKKVLWMAGQVEKIFNNRVTHLICDTNSRLTYRSAVNRGLGNYILTVEWLEKCWTSGHNEIEPELDVFKMFSGLVFCLLGFGQNEREQLELRIICQGGKIAKIGKKCTHLILKQMDRVPEKVPEHNFAVTEAWLNGCFRLNGRIDETLYFLEANTLNASLLSNTSEKSSEFSRKRGFLSTINATISPRLSGCSGLESKRRRSSRRSILEEQIQKKTAIITRV